MSGKNLFQLAAGEQQIAAQDERPRLLRHKSSFIGNCADFIDTAKGIVETVEYPMRGCEAKQALASIGWSIGGSERHLERLFCCGRFSSLQLAFADK
jgi:hypothetical protein